MKRSESNQKRVPGRKNTEIREHLVCLETETTVRRLDLSGFNPGYTAESRGDTFLYLLMNDFIPAQ